jgi:hypothetical protein
VTERLDWQAFVARSFPESTRHDFRVLKAYESYVNTCSEEPGDRRGEADALQAWEGEGGAGVGHASMGVTYATSNRRRFQ